MITIVATVLSSGCSVLTTCEDVIKRSVQSPDGAYVATWYIRDCGATTKYSSQVSVRRSRTSEDEVIFVLGRDYEIRMNWKNESVLEVTCDCVDPEVFKRITNWQGVTIDYK